LQGHPLSRNGVRKNNTLLNDKGTDLWVGTVLFAWFDGLQAVGTSRERSFSKELRGEMPTTIYWQTDDTKSDSIDAPSIRRISNKKKG